MRRVKIVFDAVVRPTGKLFRDVGPLVAKLFVQAKNFMLLFTVDWVLLDVRIQMVMPPDRLSSK